ncbi:flagellar protein FliT [Clostridium sp. DJ247]|uniref:flagellar protein FliT n=1 Tax=Clostridium sp. DJ247 TaxID=2726188 RepID=UPI0016273F21|nr:flagellar protein FliT [Clostridium sp. DJ247]MBC2582586.1 flagellar protein FliT [Clostridium sp. DJ247]
MKNKELSKALEDYKEYTLNFIYSLEKEDFDVLEKLLNNRQRIIENINSMQYTKEEFSAIVEKLEIMIYEKKLSNLMIEKRNKIKQQMTKILLSKNANNMYNKGLYSGARVFNRKI